MRADREELQRGGPPGVQLALEVAGSWAYERVKLDLVPTRTISLKLAEAMGVLSLPHSLCGVTWQSGAIWLFPSGVLGGAMGPSLRAAPRTPPSGENTTELLAATFLICPLLASSAGAASVGDWGGVFTVDDQVGPLPSEVEWRASRGGGECLICMNKGKLGYQLL